MTLTTKVLIYEGTIFSIWTAVTLIAELKHAGPLVVGLSLTFLFISAFYLLRDLGRWGIKES